ncbi:MAG: hydroxyacid dehydrogenase [Rhodobiaceae bacterium]|jgi:FAD/FMN-containing dehydrogenase|nr:hydroxyacid dehydrogenase [Rhodobiaceae bacterium]RPF96598.1 MAG: FAD-binding oxidoreductase [Rhizobiales bacterium TMED227]
MSFPDKQLEDFISKLSNILDGRDIITDQEIIYPHLQDWVGNFHGNSPLMLTPRSSEQVSKILKMCNEKNIKIVPQGGNTGSVASGIPNGEVILSLKKMNKILDLNPKDYTITVEAGCILNQIQLAASEVSRHFPLSIGSEGSCTIGGNISTNAGGISVLKYGNMRDLVLGIEVVLANGNIVNMLKKLRKDNTGYALKHLFMGAEGTLGIITAASLRLFPKIENKVTAFVSLTDLTTSMNLLEILRDFSGELLSSFELIPDIGLSIAIEFGDNIINPLVNAEQWNVIIEFSDTKNNENAKNLMEAALQHALEENVITDAVISDSIAKTQNIWKIRKAIVEHQPKLGGEIKHDVSVPISSVPDFIRTTGDKLAQYLPGVRPVPYGHIGDGNIHYNVCPPIGYSSEAFKEKTKEIREIVYGNAFTYGGSFAAEHGVGIIKKSQMIKYKDPTELTIMKEIKNLLDPKEILNPGKIF